jgi:hypothetical protein
MPDEPQLRDDLTGLKLEMQQLRAEVRDLRTVLLGASGSATSHDSDVDCKRIIQDGARAYLTGLTTSPHRENSKEEDWWRLGWQLSKDAVKSARREWT